jgi:hypothetical protein
MSTTGFIQYGTGSTTGLAPPIQTSNIVDTSLTPGNLVETGPGSMLQNGPSSTSPVFVIVTATSVIATGVISGADVELTGTSTGKTALIAPSNSLAQNTTYILPDPAQNVATLATEATPATSGNLLVAGTGGLIVNGPSSTAPVFTTLTVNSTLTLPSLAPSLPLQLSASEVVLAAALNLAAQVTGILPISNGGTNSSTALAGSKLMISNATEIVEGVLTTTNITQTLGPGTLALSIPQSVATSASPTFVGSTLSGFSTGNLVSTGAGGLLVASISSTAPVFTSSCSAPIVATNDLEIVAISTLNAGSMTVPSTLAQTTTYTLPDPGQAASNIALANSSIVSLTWVGPNTSGVLRFTNVFSISGNIASCSLSGLSLTVAPGTNTAAITNLGTEFPARYRPIVNQLVTSMVSTGVSTNTAPSNIFISTGGLITINLAYGLTLWTTGCGWPSNMFLSWSLV